MGREDPRFLAVGFVAKPHGVKGEVFVRPLTDHPGHAFAPGVVVHRGSADSGEPDPDAAPLRVTSVRPSRGGFLVRFGGVEGRDEAAALRGGYLLRPADELPPLGEGEVYLHDLVGMTVTTVDGLALGTVRHVYELQPAELLEVHGDGRVRMIPFLEHVVVEVDPAGRRLVVDPPEGLLDL